MAHPDRARLLRARVRPVQCGDEVFYISKISAACAERITEISKDPEAFDPYLPMLLVVADGVRDESGERLYGDTDDELADLKQVDLETLNALQEAILDFSTAAGGDQPGKSRRGSARRR